MVESICNKLTLKIRKKMPEIDNERAEVINYGLQLIIGEIPKLFIILLLAYLLGVLDLSLLVLLIVTPYRVVSGGAHFKTHIGCITATSVFYIGNAILSKHLNIAINIKYVIIAITWIVAIIIITKYAPADTEDVPILRKKERKIKKILSYIIMTIMLITSMIIKNRIISNILLIASILQTIALTPVMYKISHNRYGYGDFYADKIQ